MAAAEKSAAARAAGPNLQSAGESVLPCTDPCKQPAEFAVNAGLWTELS